MKVYTKSWQTVLPISIKEAWDFFSRPENLNKITPPELNFVIKSDIEHTEMYEGMFIHYTVSPVMGIPLPWTTEITHIKHHNYFIDEQRNGPYALWHHEHHFKSISANETMMNDELHYAIPLGWLGQIMNKVWISSKIDFIFDHRALVLNSTFTK